MPHRIEWRLPGRILSYHLYGDITLEELYEVSRRTRTLVRTEGVAPVHSIVDLHGVGKYPLKLHELRGIMNTDEHAMMGWCLIIAPNALLRFMSSMLVQMTHVRYRLVETAEEAEHFLAERDVTLKTLIHGHEPE